MTNDDIPEPDAPPEPIDPELERLLGWFIKHRKGRLAWELKCNRLEIIPVYPNPILRNKWEMKVVKR